MKSNEIAHSGSDSNEIAHSGSGSNLDPALKKTCDEIDATLNKIKQNKVQLDEVEYYVENSTPSWTQIGLGLLGALFATGSRPSYSSEQQDEVVDINQPISSPNREHINPNPVAIQKTRPLPQPLQGCVVKMVESWRVLFSHKCETCGNVNSGNFSVNIGGTGTNSGSFVCESCRTHQPYKVLLG